MADRPLTENDTAMDSNGWNYSRTIPKSGDARKLVWLEEDGMAWVGIRAYHHTERRWYNGNDPERAHVLCWQELPGRALRYWSHGKLSQEIRHVR